MSLHNFGCSLRLGSRILNKNQLKSWWYPEYLQIIISREWANQEASHRCTTIFPKVGSRWIVKLRGNEMELNIKCWWSCRVRKQRERCPTSPNLPRASAGSRARRLCGPYGPRRPTTSIILPLLLFFPSFPYQCLGKQVGRFSSGAWGLYIGIVSTRRDPRACDLCNATRHAQKARGMGVQNISSLFCPSWSHLLPSPSWSHFPFMTFSAQHIQSERKTNDIIGSGLRRFFIGYVKEPTRNSTRLNITLLNGYTCLRDPVKTIHWVKHAWLQFPFW